MNKKDNAKVAANGKVKIFLAAHNAALVLITLYAALLLRFNTHVVDLDAAILEQVEDIKRFAIEKKLAKLAMAELIIRYAKRAYLQAKGLGKMDVALSLDKQLYYLLRGSAKTIEARAKELVNIMEENMEDVDVITEDMVTEMRDAIKAFSDIMDIPKSEIERRRAEGTARIAALLKETDVDRADLRDLIFSYCPDLLEGYDDAARIGVPEGTKHVSLQMHVTDAVGGMALKNVVVTVTNGEKVVKKTTGAKGFTKFLGLETGLWNVVAEKKGYPVFRQDEVAVNNEKAAKMEMLLKKNALPDNDLGSFALTVYEKGTDNKLIGFELYLPSVDKTYTSDENGLFSGKDLVVGAYAGVISGKEFVTKNVSFTIDGGKETRGSFWVVRA